MLPLVDAGDLVVFDRGYPSHETLQEFASAGIEFLVRLPAVGTFRSVEAFVSSGAVDEIVTIDPPQRADPNWQPLRVRLLRIDGPDGPGYYAISLMPRSASIEDIAYLYHLLGILLGDDSHQILASIQRAMSRMLRTLDRRRPGRSYPHDLYAHVQSGVRRAVWELDAIGARPP